MIHVSVGFRKLAHGFISVCLTTVIVFSHVSKMNSAARVLTKIKKEGLVTTVVRSLHLLPVCQIIYFRILKSILISDVLMMLWSRLLRKSGTGLLIVSKVKIKHGEAAFSVYTPHIWNKFLNKSSS